MKLLLENWRKYLYRLARAYEKEWRLAIDELVVPGKGLPVSHQTSAENLEGILESGHLFPGDPYGNREAVWFTVGHNEDRVDWTGGGRTDVIIQGYIPESQLDKLQPDEAPMISDVTPEDYAAYEEAAEHYKEALYNSYGGQRKSLVGSPVFLSAEWSTDNIERVDREDETPA
tara:strand:+ start:805 stop:1323 length:519 start_codon:yes stop_codon:yes gene_type:complete